jgi:hypothetical protein
VFRVLLTDCAADNVSAHGRRNGWACQQELKKLSRNDRGMGGDDGAAMIAVRIDNPVGKDGGFQDC